MSETLLQKAERLGIKPAGQPVTPPPIAGETLLQKAQRLGVQPANPPPREGVLKTVAKNIARPFAEFGSTALNVVNATKKIVSGDVAGANEELDRVRMSDFLGEIKPAFRGEKTIGKMAKEVGGRGLEISSYLPFGLGVKGVAQQTLKGKVLQGLKIGAKEGTIGGAMVGAGGVLKEDGSAGEVVSETIKGGAMGAVGGTLLGGLAPVAGKVVRKTLFPLEKAKTAITEAIDKGIKPSVASLKTQVMRNKYYQKATEAFHVINKYRPSLTEETGEVVQRNPQNRAEMLEAVNQGKQIIFSSYDAIARKAGDFATSLFSPRAIIGKLRAISKDLSYNPQVRSYAETIIPEISELQGASPKIVQERIADLNSTLEGFFQGRVDKAKTRIDLSVAQAMREQLDKLIESATGEPYQALKNEYGALKAIEGDLARQVATEVRKDARSLIDFTDIFTGGDVLAGVIFQNPGLIAKGVTGQVLKKAYKYLNNPNRFIRNAFEAIEKLPKAKGAVPPKSPIKKPPIQAAGGLAGIEPEYDEEGNIKGYKYNPTKGALGILGMTAAKKVKPFNLKSLKTPLTQEATKYKSAEEFVKAKTNTYHSGSDVSSGVNFNKSNYFKTFFVSDSADYAKGYGGKGAILNDIHIKPDAKLIDIKNASPEEITAIRNKIQEIRDAHVPYSGKGGFNQNFGNSVDELLDGAIRGKSHFAEDPALVDVYKKLGYDGMISYEDVGMRGKNIGIWNKDKVLTKSDLTKIWNEANGGKGSTTVKNLIIGGGLGASAIVGQKLKDRRIDEVKKVLKDFGFKEEYINQIKSVKTSPVKSYYGYEKNFKGARGMVDPKNRSIFLTPDASNGTIVEEAVHAIDLSGEGFSGFPVKEFKADWDKASLRFPILKEVEKELPIAEKKHGNAHMNSAIELEKLAFLVRNMYEDNLKITDLPQELQKYVQFYFK